MIFVLARLGYLGTGAHSLVPATKVLILLRPNLLPMMAKGGVVLRRHI